MRFLPVLLVALLAVFAGGAVAMQALRTNDEQPGLRLSIVPARQTASPGQRLAFSVTVSPTDRPVRLRATRLPPGMRAVFRLNNGARSAVVPPGQNGAILTVVASRTARPGPTRIVVLASSAGRTRRRAVRVTLVPRRRPFSIVARPARLTVLAGKAGAYAVRLRGRAHRGVRLRVRGLPGGVRPAWSPSATLAGGHRGRLTVRVWPGTPPGSRRIVISAGRVRRAAVVVLNIRQGRPFGISGDLGALLSPGRNEPLDLRLTNPNDFTIKVSELSVAIRPTTSNPGCGADNYAVTQYRGPYPLTLPPGTTSLAGLVSDRSLWPQIGMLDRPTNQDACKLARLTLDYDGKAAR